MATTNDTVSASAYNSPDEEKEVVVKVEVVDKEYDKAHGLVENNVKDEEDYEDQDKVNQDEVQDEDSDEDDEDDDKDQDNENSDDANANETDNVDEATDDNVKDQDEDEDDSDEDDDEDSDEDDDEDQDVNENKDIDDEIEDEDEDQDQDEDEDEDQDEDEDEDEDLFNENVTTFNKNPPVDVAPPPRSHPMVPRKRTRFKDGDLPPSKVLKTEKDKEVEATNITLIDANNGASIDVTPNGGVIPRRKRKIRTEAQEEIPLPVKAIKRGNEFFLSFDGKEYPIKVEDADAIGVGNRDQDQDQDREHEQEQSPVSHVPIPKRTKGLSAKPPTRSAYSTYSTYYTGPPNPLATLNPKDLGEPSEAQSVMKNLSDTLNDSKVRSPLKEVEKIWFVAEMSTFEFNLLLKFFELNPKPMRSYFTASGSFMFEGPEVDNFPDKEKRLSTDEVCKMFPVFYENGLQPTYFIPIPRGPTTFTFTAEANSDNVGIEEGFYFDMWLSEYPPTPTNFNYSIPWSIPYDSKNPIGIPISPAFTSIPTRFYTTRLYIFDEGDLGDGKNVAPFRCASLGFGRQQGAAAEAPKCSGSFSIQSLTPRTRL